jgi:nucleotide-binding universal stress UspA family protein
MLWSEQSYGRAAVNRAFAEIGCERFEEAQMIGNFKVLLAPVDFSDYSIRAATHAYELSKAVGGQLHMLHVVVPHHSLLPLIPLVADAERARELAREASMVEQAEAELARLKAEWMENSPTVTTLALVGSPAARIRDYAAEQNVDLIVISTHGRTGVEHMLIGSVAEKLVRTAHCSVTVLRPPRR